jgi:hypothetical protein
MRLVGISLSKAQVTEQLEGLKTDKDGNFELSELDSVLRRDAVLQEEGIEYERPIILDLLPLVARTFDAHATVAAALKEARERDYKINREKAQALRRLKHGKLKAKAMLRSPSILVAAGFGKGRVEREMDALVAEEAALLREKERLERKQQRSLMAAAVDGTGGGGGGDRRHKPRPSPAREVGELTEADKLAAVELDPSPTRRRMVERAANENAVAAGSGSAAVASKRRSMRVSTSMPALPGRSSSHSSASSPALNLPPLRFRSSPPNRRPSPAVPSTTAEQRALDRHGRRIRRGLDGPVHSSEGRFRSLEARLLGSTRDQEKTFA